ncbi:MAG TPA: hypothetical protein VKT49_02470 [Bryobacteraceae bacterium]|nr:hypothetical protein [Bryobacteraceae bacterium]
MVRRIAVLLLAGTAAFAQEVSRDFLNHSRPLVDAHNCYPYDGRWADRIDRALGAGYPVAIEQDLAWGIDGETGKPAAVVAHSAKTSGGEPTLRKYFFERVRPVVEAALAANERAHWPIIILHFDFKSNEPALLRAVWDVLGSYEAWLTTAVKISDPSELQPFDRKPLLAITEDSDAQEEVFFRAVPVGGRLRVFGSAHTRGLNSTAREQWAHRAATLPPEALLTEPPTNYRRWWNNSWAEVEEGGQRQAGEWTPADNERLRALVDRAHRLGYWIRFYTLDGFAPGEDQGWDQNYNFGSPAAVRLRWNAAIQAGVDLIATDEYEELRDVLKAATVPATQ